MSDHTLPYNEDRDPDLSHEFWSVILLSWDISEIDDLAEWAKEVEKLTQ